MRVAFSVGIDAEQTQPASAVAHYALRITLPIRRPGGGRKAISSARPTRPGACFGQHAGAPIGPHGPPRPRRRAAARAPLRRDRRPARACQQTCGRRPQGARLRLGHALGQRKRPAPAFRRCRPLGRTAQWARPRLHARGGPPLKAPACSPNCMRGPLFSWRGERVPAPGPPRRAGRPLRRRTAGLCPARPRLNGGLILVRPEWVICVHNSTKVLGCQEGNAG